MTQSTQELLADIANETKLNNITQCNKVMNILNNTFKVWNVIDNKHSGCITVKAITNRGRKVNTYVLNGNGQLLLNGKKEIGRIDYDLNYNHVSSSVFRDYLTQDQIDNTYIQLKGLT